MQTKKLIHWIVISVFSFFPFLAKALLFYWEKPSVPIEHFVFGDGTLYVMTAILAAGSLIEIINSNMPRIFIEVLVSLQVIMIFTAAISYAYNISSFLAQPIEVIVFESKIMFFFTLLVSWLAVLMSGRRLEEV